jgi:hypothetical protein
MKKLMIASPCYHGKVDTQFTLSLIQSLYLLDHSNIQTVVLLPATGSILAKERNDILEAFMQSDCTHLLMVDSDMGWQPDAPKKYLDYDVDFIAGCYPARTNNRNSPEFIFVPDAEKSGNIKRDENKKLLKILRAPAGFMMVSRNMIELMRDKYEHLYFEGVGNNNNFKSGYALFNTEIINGNFWGEDYVFCKRAIDAGFTIWCDPNIVFDHAGVIGSLTDILTTSRPVLDNTFVYDTKI